jgi:hypothetical protein
MVAKVIEFFSWFQLKLARVNLVVKELQMGEINYSYYLGKDFKELY